MKEKFREAKLSKSNKQKLVLINQIIEEYQDEGYTLTLRQLYYQLVSRDVIPNRQSEYAKLSKLLKEGRMSGQVDWMAIEDRLRVVNKKTSWDNPKSILESAAYQYQKDRHKGQDVFVEVWVEKDALSQVVQRAANKYQVGVLVNRGYGSVSAMYEAYSRYAHRIQSGKKVVILYLGDHDPSGIDMIRDIRGRISEMLLSEMRNHIQQWYNESDFLDEDIYEYDRCLEKRLKGLSYWDDNHSSEFDKVLADFYMEQQRVFTVKAIALTMDQINQYNPPPNPAKLTDPRGTGYVEKFGAVSWEVDALTPQVLNELICVNIEENIDIDLYNDIVQEENEEKDKMNEFINKF